MVRIARAVVGADGTTSVVRRAVVHERTPRVSYLLKILVPQDLQAPMPLGFDQGGEGRAIVDFSCIADGVQGYIWNFPAPTSARCQPVRTWGIFDSRIHPRAPRVSLEAVLQETLAPLGVVSDRYELSRLN